MRIIDWGRGNKYQGVLARDLSILYEVDLRMTEAYHCSPGLPVRSYSGSDSSATLSKQRSGHRVLMKLSLALTVTCTLLFLIVFVPHLHSHFYMISGSSASADGVQYSPSDLAGLTDRIVPYKMRVGYFTYSKPLTDDRVIAVYPPHYVPGADVRDENPALRGMRPGIREEYIDDVYPVVLRISPKIPTGGLVSLIGLRFGESGSACKCNFGGVVAVSCEVKTPELAIIQLPAGAHFQIAREANMQPAFVEVKMNSGRHYGVSRLSFGAAADAESTVARAQHSQVSEVPFGADTDDAPLAAQTQQSYSSDAMPMVSTHFVLLRTSTSLVPTRKCLTCVIRSLAGS
jgi:hypothetical protein